MTMEADIAEIKTHVLYLRERAEREATRGDKLEGRVDVLEREKVRLYAYVGGAVSAGVFLLDWVKSHIHLLVPVLVWLFYGCAAVGPNGADTYWHDSAKPVPVYLHAEMRPACIDAMLGARDFWRDKCLVDYLRPRVAGDEWEGWYGSDGPRGTISVRDGTLLPPVLGVAQQRQLNARMRSCRIKMSTEMRDEDVCAMNVAAHELGHCLGLEHTEEADESDHLMFWIANGGLEVTQDECAWVVQ